MPSEELDKKALFAKKLMDKAFLANKLKYGYGEKNAANAMEMFLIDYDTMSFTRDNGARRDMTILDKHPYEIYRVLMEFAIQSFKLNNMDNHFTIEEITAYTWDKEKKLDYSEDRIVAIVAAATAWSPYWTINLFATNNEVKRVLAKRFVKERYLQKRKKELDAVTGSKLIHIKNTKDLYFSSVERLNNDIANMIRDEEGVWLADTYDKELQIEETKKSK